MKKLFLSLILMVAFLATNAQVVTMTQNTDSVKNTTPKYLYQTFTQDYSGAIFYLLFTEVSGTTDGTAILQGSGNGTNYATIADADTVTLTDVASQYFVFNYPNVLPKYVRWKIVGVGTMTDLVVGQTQPSKYFH